ncbi:MULTISPECIES: non-ribosomal peptide synthetase [unclassified Streptomyces]|uniref:non-ribosomal peptide synthetase n=1 Tax=unclassified Streptomyces TaxID=2593676 RepID=UPI002E75FB16|nr:non-ribosomal peptide synthetase [Streptomyces sp. JV190]MEE1838909.1 non-ribosomal peptide synthetase [Streptomyces sp. JV190]
MSSLTSPDLPADLTLPRLFEKTVARFGARTALVYRGEHISYAELNSLANKAARSLRQGEVGQGTPVGLHLNRSVELYVMMLAVLKAGGCVVPLNPAHPERVIKDVLDTASVRLVVHQGEWDTAVFGDHIPELCAADVMERAEPLADSDPETEVDAESTAFIMFTSGSTGRPKGVRIPHRGLARLAVPSEELRIDEQDCFVQQAAFSFAASTIEIWQSLLHGAKLVVLPPGLPTLPELRDVIEEHRVTFLSLPCGLFNLLVDNEIESLRHLRVITISGDFPSPGHLARAARETNARIYNCYGCTEGSSLVAVHPVTAPDSLARTKAVPVGRPMPLMNMAVLDERLEPCAPGETGELYIGGAGVARGYVGDEELTARKFIPGPRPGDGLLYRTGDLARTTPEGDVVLAGRADNMVKIRGYRVEPTAVELALKAHDAIDQAVVKAFGDEVTQKTLVAFFTTRDDRRPAHSELVAHLGELLQDYMIPSDFHRLDAFPVNVNGKIDRSALRAPDTVDQRLEKGARMNSPLEAAVLQIWKDIIGVEDCSTTDAFLGNGGNSLHFVQLASHLKNVLAIDVGVEDVFRCGNVEKLARHIEEIREGVH